MKINVTSVLKSFPGDELKDAKGEPMTFRSVFGTVLGTMRDGEEIDGDKKYQMYNIGVKIYATDEVQLKPEEAVILKERVAVFYSPVVYGQVCDLLDKTK